MQGRIYVPETNSPKASRRVLGKYESYHLFVNGRKELDDLEDPMWRRCMEKLSVEKCLITMTSST
jgi:hypothetical protein